MRFPGGGDDGLAGISTEGATRQQTETCDETAIEAVTDSMRKERDVPPRLRHPE
jgi:hypothetical protein